jgi:hypothetical protein
MMLRSVILTATTIVFFSIKDQEKAVREKEKKKEKGQENENNRPKSKPRKK